MFIFPRIVHFHTMQRLFFVAIMHLIREGSGSGLVRRYT